MMPFIDEFAGFAGIAGFEPTPFTRENMNFGVPPKSHKAAVEGLKQNPRTPQYPQSASRVGLPIPAPQKAAPCPTDKCGSRPQPGCRPVKL
jgi:hypothetical protein